MAQHPAGEVLPDPLNELAVRHLGIAYLFPYQRLVISNLLEGRSQIVVLPTGSGKSVCFMFPAVVLPGVTLVVLPLLALLEDLHRRIAAAGLAVAVLRGGQSGAERARVLEAVGTRRVRLVLTTPETALTNRLLAALTAADAIEHLVVDEAHCIGEWGDRFRPTYLRLGELVAALQPRVVTAFTATATPPVLQRIREVLFPAGGAHLVAGNPDRPNIRYEVSPTVAPLRRLSELVAARPRPLIVFARSRRGVEAVCWHLRRRQPAIDCRFYHAGLNPRERQRLERWFLTSRAGVLIATSAYGMGVDKPDIRSVIHLGPPESVEAYLQETGRAGRDGAPAQAMLIAYQPTAELAATAPAPAPATRTDPHVSTHADPPAATPRDPHPPSLPRNGLPRTDRRGDPGIAPAGGSERPAHAHRHRHGRATGAATGSVRITRSGRPATRRARTRARAGAAWLPHRHRHLPARAAIALLSPRAGRVHGLRRV